MLLNIVQYREMRCQIPKRLRRIAEFCWRFRVRSSAWCGVCIMWCDDVWVQLSFSYFPLSLHFLRTSSFSCPSLHNHTASTAASAVFSLIYLQFTCWSTIPRIAPTSSWISCHFLVIASYFTNNIVECVVDIDTWLCRSLDEFTAEWSCERLSLWIPRN